MSNLMGPLVRFGVKDPGNLGVAGGQQNGQVQLATVRAKSETHRMTQVIVHMAIDTCHCAHGQEYIYLFNWLRTTSRLTDRALDRAVLAARFTSVKQAPKPGFQD